LGYLVFYFDFYHKENFNRVSQITTWISNALFGFRTLQYQHYLQNRIERMYSLDALTGLYNRTAFLKMFEALKKNDKTEFLTLVMCDLDNLKMINDTYGHAHGDIAIKTVANAFLSSFDSNECICCRYGGDEILALFTKKVDSKSIEDKINNYIDEYNVNSGNPYKVSASIGIHSSDDKNFDAMLSFADELMYSKKIAKKNRRK
ncbi:MAG: GGDEF domain-containing protein, partial [Treponema sp.]|nr:GGDEF domain-containing protein [Treponema sp.]